MALIAKPDKLARMDMLAAMRVYTRVVELGGLSAAARDLRMSQPAVSETVARLEARLQARLLDRTTRSVRTTEAGSVFYERARRTLDEAAEAEAAVASLKGGLRGRLRIASPYGIGELLITPVLLDLMAEHPELRVEFVLNDRFVDPLAEGVDLSIRVGPVGIGDYVARRLGAIRRVLVASPDYLERRGRPATPDDLAEHGFIRFAGLLAGDRMTLTGPGGTTEVMVRTVLSANHWRPLIRAVLQGLGIGAVQSPMAEEGLRSGDLARVLPDFTLAAQEVHAIYPAARHVPERTKLLVDLLQTALEARLPS
jgi:DNA-binding transcriptional LysR family regulator